VRADPSRGLHVVVAFEEGEPPRTRHLVDAAGRRIGELRSAGAYIVAWPSVVGGRPYELLSPVAPQEVVKRFLTSEDGEAFLLGLLREAGVELEESGPGGSGDGTGSPSPKGAGTTAWCPWPASCGRPGSR